MVNLSYSVIKNPTPVSESKFDPPMSATLPSTQDESASPVMNPMLRKFHDDDNERVIYVPNDASSLVSDITTTIPDTLKPLQYQLDPPGTTLRYNKIEADTPLYELPSNLDAAGSHIRKHLDPPPSDLAIPDVKESIVTRVFGIVDLSCVSPFTEPKTSDVISNTDASGLCTSDHMQNHTSEEFKQNFIWSTNDKIQSGPLRATEAVESPDITKYHHHDQGVVCITPDENHQAHLQLNLPVVSPSRSTKVSPPERSKIDDTTNEESKSNWIKKKLGGGLKPSPDGINNNKVTRRSEAQPRQKVETVLGIVPFSILTEKDKGFILPFRSPPKFSKAAESVVIEEISDNENDDTDKQYTSKNLHSEKSQPLSSRTSNESSRYVSPSRQDYSSPRTSRKTKENTNIDSIAYRPINLKSNTSTKPEIKPSSSSTSAASKFFRKAHIPLSTIEDPRVLKKLKLSSQKIRLKLDLLKKRDTKTNVAASSHSQQNTKTEKNSEVRRLDSKNNSLLETGTPPKLSKAKEATDDPQTEVVTISEPGNGDNPHGRTRKVLTSIKNAINGQLETVEELEDEEVSVSTSGSELLVRIPGVHHGAPDAYIRGKDLIGDEYVDEAVTFSSDNSCNRSGIEDDEILSSSASEHNNGVANIEKLHKKKSLDVLESRISTLQVNNFILNRKHDDPVIEHKSPEREIRDTRSLQSTFSPTVSNRNKSWSELLGGMAHDLTISTEQDLTSNTKDKLVPNVAQHKHTTVRNDKQESLHGSHMHTSKHTDKVKHKPMWKAVVDPKSNRTYYYHRKTRETTWSKPPDADIVSVKPKKNHSDVSSTVEANVSQKFPSDLDPVAYEKKQEIARVLTQIINPPNSESIQSIIERFDGQEEALLLRLRSLNESKPFDEPIKNRDKSAVYEVLASTEDKQRQQVNYNDDGGVLERAQSGASIAFSHTMASIYSGITGNLSSGTRKSDLTQPIRNTSSSKPNIAIKDENKNENNKTSSDSLTDDLPSVQHVRRRLPSTNAPIPKNIPVPRTRDLTVEEFTTRDPVFGVKESDFIERKARGFLNRQLRLQHQNDYSNNNNDRSTNQKTIMNSQPSTLTALKETVIYGNPLSTNPIHSYYPLSNKHKEVDVNEHTTDNDTVDDTVSALSDADLSFFMQQRKPELSEQARYTSERLIQRNALETMQLDHIDPVTTIRRQHPSSSRLNSTSGTTTLSSPLDQFISENDWDAVASYIHKVRSQESNNLHNATQQNLKPNSFLRHQNRVVADVVRRSHKEEEYHSKSPTQGRINGIFHSKRPNVSPVLRFRQQQQQQQQQHEMQHTRRGRGRSPRDNCHDYTRHKDGEQPNKSRQSIFREQNHLTRSKNYDGYSCSSACSSKSFSSYSSGTTSNSYLSEEDS